MYKCICYTMKSFKEINITTFSQNQFMTCYLIFNFRPTYFSYFRKITANSHNVKKEVGPNGPIPVVKGLRYCFTPRRSFGRARQGGGRYFITVLGYHPKSGLERLKTCPIACGACLLLCFFDSMCLKFLNQL